MVVNPAYVCGYCFGFARLTCSRCKSIRYCDKTTLQIQSRNTFSKNNAAHFWRCRQVRGKSSDTMKVCVLTDCLADGEHELIQILSVSGRCIDYS